MEMEKLFLEAKLDDLLKADSNLFQNTRWKVLCSDDFRKSFWKLESPLTQKLVLILLLKLSNGWRPKRRKVDSKCETSSMVLKKFKVEDLYIVCSIDVVKEQWQSYTQVLKAWDLLPLLDIERLVQRLDGIFEMYTDDFISLCNEKYLEGDLEVPGTWTNSIDIIRYKQLAHDISESASDGRFYVENTNVSDSLLLMKFYALSSGLVNNLLSSQDGRQLDLPFEVTDQELDVILFQGSSFILGRSGTGKTTVLSMKMFQKEQLYLFATQGLGQVNMKNSNQLYQASRLVDQATVLRQLFVTVNPLLCHAVKNHILQLKRFASGGNYIRESALQNVDDIDSAAQFKDIPDSFIDILPKEYPLVITLQKFLIMLDGTIGSSFFEKFSDARELSNWEVGKAPIFLRNFIRTREVNYEKFCSSYWPHFNDKLTKKLDSSRVFTEIMSHIKGGFRSGVSCDGRLNEKDYINLSECRFSTLSRDERQIIYEIFKCYEKRKGQNSEFDMADLVIDLHRRFQNERYEGDIMDFVYIDEVQDLTMRQIALFKYVCKNVSEGFVFCGDTAQTIARGIDFRFEDIRSLFYSQFALDSKCKANDGKKGKAQLYNNFQLSQNFRTHDGVLRLAQSVIDLLHHFFPSFVDVLCAENSLIYGEAPILLEPEEGDNAIATIFEFLSKPEEGDVVEFGAEQVILVRDDHARNEILKHVGKQALVLTVLECKGLEFQDVLLYNFFGSSPSKSQWRVVYEYMKEQGLLDSSWQSPSFKHEIHNVLCSELKQLYVAITRTRQRLWICENEEEYSKPMFDYWKKMSLVQVKKLDDSLVRSMQVASSLGEWKSRGYELLRQRNYVMAMRCFERAHDTYGKKLAEALGLREDADCLQGFNPERASAWRQAAAIFYYIGKVEEAADCFYMSKEYEQAGQIYLEKCGESAVKRAAECFVLAGRFEKAGQIYLEKCGESYVEKAAECFFQAGSYKTAAEAYAKGNYFSKCLSVCTKGKLFETGMQFLKYWKGHELSEGIEESKQKFLKSAARHYHKINDKSTMMNYVRAFDSMSSIRTFLQSLDCLGELLCLEEEFGNFLEAASIAKYRGEILLAADLLGKGSHFEEAATLVLLYVFVNSLWFAGSTGWPLQQFAEKEKLLKKAKSFAMKVSNQFNGLVCLESDILVTKPSNIRLMERYLSASRRHESTRGEVLTARMILDYHLVNNSKNYVWIDELVLDVESFSKEQISNNRISTDTLVYFWNFWKERIMKILEYLDHAKMQETSDHRRYGEFCLNYFGVWRQFKNAKTVYLVLNSDDEPKWLRKLSGEYVCSNQKPIPIPFHQFVAAARSYWCSELLSVGLQVLRKLEESYNFSCKNSYSTFYESRSLTYIYEVAISLVKSRFLNIQHANKDLMKFVRLAKRNYFRCIFPLDWRDSLTANMISLRRTETSRNLLQEVIFEKIMSNDDGLSYVGIGMVALMILGSHQLNNKVYGKILEELEGKNAWKNFIASLQRDRAYSPVYVTGHSRSESITRPHAGSIEETGNEEPIVFKFHEALKDTYSADWMSISDYMSPVCFLYLLERYLVMLSHFKGFFFTTKTTFVEWLIVDMPFHKSIIDMEDLLIVVSDMVQNFLYNWGETIHWIEKSHINVNEYRSLLVLRLVVIICMLHLNFGKRLDLLSDLLEEKHITELLPLNFYDALRSWVKGNCQNNLYVLAQAFQNIRNPLIIVGMEENRPIFACSDGFFIDMEANPCKEDIFRVLFPKSESPRGSTRICAAKFSEVLTASKNSNDCNMQVNLVQFWEIVEALQAVDDIKDQSTVMSNASIMKVYLGKCIFHLIAARKGCLQTKPAGNEESFPEEVIDLLHKMKQQQSYWNQGQFHTLQQDENLMSEECSLLR